MIEIILLGSKFKLDWSRNYVIAKIGKRGKPFPVGAQHEVKADSKGRLYLGLNDKDLGNNQGHYLAKITVK